MSQIQPGRAVLGGRAGRVRQVWIEYAVVGRDLLPIGIAAYPDHLFAQFGQSVQGFGGHGSGGYVAVENDGVDTNRVYVTKDRVEGRQVAMNVGQHRGSHPDPFRSFRR